MSTTPNHILLIRPSALGDVCRSVSLLVSLRKAFKDATIDWLVQDSFVDAVRQHPDLTRVVPFSRNNFGRDLRSGRFGTLRAFMRDLRGSDYDLVFDCQGLARSGLFTWATKAPRRIGFANAREFGWIGYNERYNVDNAIHTVDRMLKLIEHAGIEPVTDMRLYTNETDRAWTSNQIQTGRYAVIAPTSRWPGKRWPAERFAAVARSLFERGIESVILVGSPGEEDQCKPLTENSDNRIINLIGATSIGQLMAVIEGSSLVIANDSAALHMAIGFDRPAVALFGPTRVDLVGPYRRQNDVIQHVGPGDRLDHKTEALGRPLMERITVDEVMAKIDQRLNA